MCPAGYFRRLAPWCISSFLGAALATQTFAGGLTIITHGLNSNIDDWVIAMAQSIPVRLARTNFSCYEIYFTLSGTTFVPTWRRLAGGTPADTDSAEIVIKLDWRQLANNSYSTYQVAASVVPTLLQTGFISEWPEHALAELPIHLVGHSRGGSLICEMSRLLGTNGVWVDHLTTLDPHPLNNDGFSDQPFYTVVDAPARTYENVLFHDNYYERLNSVAYGEAVGGAYIRQLKNLDGGYSGLTGSHSDVHLWYHGTVALQTPASDTAANITSAERQTWWNSYENAGVSAGFYYSLIGGGDRLSTNQPDGSATNRIRDGYNQMWDLGGGLGNNRTSLSTNRGLWPNLIKFGLTGSNVVAHGESNSVALFYQWARPEASDAVINLYLDNDSNPYNGNETLVQTTGVSGTGAAGPAYRAYSFGLDAANAPPGEHSIYARITGGGQTRSLYAAQSLTVMSSFAPPRLEVFRAGRSQVQIDLNGVAGQRLVLQTSADLLSWQSVATNWLAQNRWTYVDNGAASHRFYRAAVR